MTNPSIWMDFHLGTAFDVDRSMCIPLDLAIWASWLLGVMRYAFVRLSSELSVRLCHITITTYVCRIENLSWRAVILVGYSLIVPLVEVTCACKFCRVLGGSSTWSEISEVILESSASCLVLAKFYYSFKSDSCPISLYPNKFFFSPHRS